MNRHAVQLIARGAIDKIGNMLMTMGTVFGWPQWGRWIVLGIYQISELVTAILANPFGGVISDRFSRQDFDDDRLCGFVWAFLLSERSLDDCSLIFANIETRPLPSLF